MVLALVCLLALGPASPLWAKDQRRFAADASAQLSMGNPAAALQSAQEGLRYDANDAWLHTLAARAHMALNDDASALEQLKDALRLSPQDIVAKTLFEQIRQHPPQKPATKGKPETAFSSLKAGAQQEHAQAAAQDPCRLPSTINRLLVVATPGEGEAEVALLALALAKAFEPFGQAFVVDAAMASEPQAVARLRDLLGVDLCLAVRAAAQPTARLIALDASPKAGPALNAAVSLDVVNAADPLELAVAATKISVGRSHAVAVAAYAAAVGRLAGLPLTLAPAGKAALLPGVDLELQLPKLQAGKPALSKNQLEQLASALAKASSAGNGQAGL